WSGVNDIVSAAEVAVIIEEAQHKPILLRISLTSIVESIVQHISENNFMQFKLSVPEITSLYLIKASSAILKSMERFYENLVRYLLCNATLKCTSTDKN
ncbi:hypothetical protein HHI36_009944, partial [Cryptolaemus montrouzieri]